MQPFYLIKNANGYYRADFIDCVTGQVTFRKSTHCRNRIEATNLASKWIETGIPQAKSHSRQFQNSINPKQPESGIDLQNLVERLSKAEITALVALLAQKMGIADELENDRLEKAQPTNQQPPVPTQPQPQIYQTQPQPQPQPAIVHQTQTTQTPATLPVAQQPVQTVPAVQQLTRQTQPQQIVPQPAQAPKVVLIKRKKPAKPQEPATLEKKQPTQQPAKTFKAVEKLDPNQPLYSYLYNFWDYDTSRFIAEERALGKNVTKRHCAEQQKLAKRYWLPYFGESATAQMLDKNILEDFFFYLRLDLGLSGSTVNQAINCGRRAMTYLYHNKHLAENPFEGVRRFSPQQMQRGIPTETEVKNLLALEWENRTSKLAFKLGAFCCLRAGEISGLQTCDIDLEADMLYIRHSWNDTDGLKSTKNGENRTIPVDHTLALELMNHAKTNPNFNDTSFVFYSPKMPNQPLWPSYYQDAFYEALAEIGVSEAQRKERNIVFHSLRHFGATILRQRLDIAMVQEVMGHKTAAMTEHYSSHQNETKFKLIKEAMNSCASELLA